jgi:hypothetical protein
MSFSASPQLAPGKACGSCMMCCKLPRIEELKKPPGVWCHHMTIGKGCNIYENRPPVCRSFYCRWMLDSSLGPEWKPEKAKFVMFSHPKNRELLYILVDPHFPDAWTKPPYDTAIKRWVMDGTNLGRGAIVSIALRRIAVLPDRIIELGKYNENDFVLFPEYDLTGKMINVRIDVRP